MPGQFADLERALLEFRDRRDWKRFHTPRHLCASVAIEAAELLELTQWKTDEEFEHWAAAHRDIVAAECADVLAYLLLLGNVLQFDLADALRAKMEVNEHRFPPPR